MKKRFNVFLLTLSLAAIAAPALADGISIDKIYLPYVQPLEKELEYRLLSTSDSPNFQRNLFGYGQALSESDFLEIYLVSNNSEGSGQQLEAMELEYRLQLTEQGEYSVDWGLQFELEREFSDNVWEASTTAITAMDLGDFTWVNNFSVIYEMGEHIDNEFETAFATQLSYRYSAKFEPAIAAYLSQDTQALGPVFQGQVRLEKTRKLFWRAGMIWGTNSTTPKQHWLLELEYEFY